MKGIVWVFSLVFCLFFGLRLWSLIARGFANAGIIQKFDVTFDTTLSSVAQQDIYQFLQESPLFKQMSCAQIITCLQKQFSFIEQGILHKKPCGTLSVHLICAKPWRRINEHLLVTKQGTLITAALFDETLVAQLPHITIEQPILDQTTVVVDCAEFLTAFPETLYNDFAITWITPTKALMVDKSQPLFSIVINNDRMPDGTLLQACKKIERDLDMKGLFKGPQAKQWFADIRFKNQIVVYARNRGRGV